jgi:hypothetical protein
MPSALLTGLLLSRFVSLTQAAACQEPVEGDHAIDYMLPRGADCECGAVVLAHKWKSILPERLDAVSPP